MSTIEAATNNFAQVNKIGAGGFGSVYKVRNDAYRFEFSLCFTKIGWRIETKLRTLMKLILAMVFD